MLQKKKTKKQIVYTKENKVADFCGCEVIVRVTNENKKVGLLLLGKASKLVKETLYLINL